MVPRLLEEVEEILAWYELEHEQEERRGVEYAMQRHDVGVLRERLVYLSLFV